MDVPGLRRDQERLRDDHDLISTWTSFDLKQVRQAMASPALAVGLYQWSVSMQALTFTRLFDHPVSNGLGIVRFWIEL
jgi:hypothetical protein